MDNKFESIKIAGNNIGSPIGGKLEGNIINNINTGTPNQKKCKKKPKPILRNKGKVADKIVNLIQSEKVIINENNRELSN